MAVGPFISGRTVPPSGRAVGELLGEPSREQLAASGESLTRGLAFFIVTDGLRPNGSSPRNGGRAMRRRYGAARVTDAPDFLERHGPMLTPTCSACHEADDLDALRVIGGRFLHPGCEPDPAGRDDGDAR